MARLVSAGDFRRHGWGKIPACRWGEYDHSQPQVSIVHSRWAAEDAILLHLNPILEVVHFLKSGVSILSYICSETHIKNQYPMKHTTLEWFGQLKLLVYSSLADWENKLGATTFRLRIRGVTIFLDTWLDRPSVLPVYLAVDQVTDADYIFISHAHFDQ